MAAPQPLWVRCSLRALDFLEDAPVRALPWFSFAAALALAALVDASSRADTVILAAAALALRVLLGGGGRRAGERAAALVGLAGGALFYAGELGPGARGAASGAARGIAAFLAAARPEQPAPDVEAIGRALRYVAWASVASTAVASSTRIFPARKPDAEQDVRGGEADSAAEAAKKKR